jgi:methylenetetrahydrofolate dehydrogenase (NADP+)/methenyltetrahydrofolate cyclohydrolase
MFVLFTTPTSVYNVRSDTRSPETNFTLLVSQKKRYNAFSHGRNVSASDGSVRRNATFLRKGGFYMTLELRGKPLADALKSWCAEKIIELKETRQAPPGLAIVQVGSDAGSEAYLQQKVKNGEKLGMSVRVFSSPATTEKEKVLEWLHVLNADTEIDGIFIEHPLPEGWEVALRSALLPEKDVEGLHPLNLGRLYLGEKGFPLPCTAEAVIRLLEWYALDCLDGLSAVVMGRSVSVGRALALLLLGKNATVTVVHSRSKNPAMFLESADVVITAVGKAHIINAIQLKPGSVLVDVGTNVTSEGALVGDAKTESSSHLKAFSPVPGGIGPVTVSILLANVTRNALLRARASDPFFHYRADIPSTQELAQGSAQNKNP